MGRVVEMFSELDKRDNVWSYNKIYAYVRL